MLKNCIPRFYKSFRRCHLMMCILIIVCANTCDVFAQYSYERKVRDTTLNDDRKINIIKTNVLGYLIGDYNVTYERLSKTRKISRLLKFDYLSVYSSDSTLKASGPSIRGGVRIYLTKKRQPPAGYYVQVFVTYGEYKLQDIPRKIGYRVAYVGGGLLLGKQWAIGGRLTIDVFLKGEYLSYSLGNYKDVLQTIDIAPGGSVGFRF